MESLRHRFQTELDLVGWQDLARHFAFQRLYFVEQDLDIIQVAIAIASDNATDVKGWLDAGRIRLVSDQEAQAWSISPELRFEMLIVQPFVIVKRPPLNLPH